MNLPTTLIGGLVIIASFLFYGKAYLLYKKGKTLPTLYLIIFTGLCLRIFCATDPMLHQWDERYHALVAKNLMDSPFEPKLYKETPIEYDYKDWTANKVWLHKQVFPLWMIALSMKIFGVSEFAVRIPSLLFSTIGIFLTFLIGKHLFREKIGLIAAFFFSINGLIIELAAGRVSTDHVDICFSFLVLLSVVFVVFNNIKKQRRYILLAGLTCGLAILTKWLAALIIAPLYLVLNYKDKSILNMIKDILLFLLIIVSVAAPWQWYCYHHFQAEYLWEQHFNFLHFVADIEGHGQEWWYHLNKIRITINELIYIILLWFVYKIVKIKCSKEDIFLLLWIGIPLVVFSYATTKMQAYLLFSFPAYFIIMALFIDTLDQKTAQKNKLKYQWIYSLLIISIFLLSFRFGIERVKPFDSKEIARANKMEIKQLNLPDKGIIFNASLAIEIMFHSNSLAYRHIPKIEVIDELIDQGYQIYLLDDGQLPSDVVDKSQVTRIRFKTH